MQNKAKSSWTIAEKFVKEDDSLNFAANRFYYALFQAAWWRNAQLKPPLTKESGEGYHEFAKRIVCTIVNNDKNHVRIFLKFKSLRVKADYKPVDIKRYELHQIYIQQANELFDVLLLGDE